MRTEKILIKTKLSEIECVCAVTVCGKLQSICVRIEQSEFGSYKNLLLLNLEAGRCGCSYLLLFCVRRLE